MIAAIGHFLYGELRTYAMETMVGITAIKMNIYYGIRGLWEEHLEQRQVDDWIGDMVAARKAREVPGLQSILADPTD